VAEQLGTVLLGQVPLIADIRAGGDSGRPITVGAPASAAATAAAATVVNMLKSI
jgi:ATP-binding protein involved in chromosome partitioning